MNREWSPAVEAFWQDYCAQCGRTPNQRPIVFSFDGTPDIADKLAQLVLVGRKRATAGALVDFTELGEAMPRPDDLSLLVDGAGLPCCIIRTSEIRMGPLQSVDDAFAWDEGEGDRTREYWMGVHRDYIARRALLAGVPMHDGIETVFERFTVVWPPEHADPE